MRRQSVHAASAALAALALFLAEPAWAQAHKCQTPGGPVTYSDQPCANAQAGGPITLRPNSMDGSEGGAAAKARAWARKLARRIAPVGVRMVDERLTTVAAHAALTEAGREIRRQRDIVDQAAASIILNTALETERRTGRAPGQGVGIRDGDT